MVREHILWYENTFYGKKTHSILQRALLMMRTGRTLCAPAYLETEGEGGREGRSEGEEGGQVGGEREHMRKRG